MSRPHRHAGARARIAIFNPVFAHYRAALLQELRRSSRADYHFFADLRDGDSAIPGIDFSGSRDFTYSPFFSVFKHGVWQPQAVRTAWSGDYDCFVFLGNAAWLSTWLAALIVRLRGRRVMFWTHGWLRHDQGLRRYLRLAFYNLAHGLLLYGERALQLGIGLGFRPDKLHVMYNSLDFEAQQILAARSGSDDAMAQRAALFDDPSTPVVIATARLTAIKRFDLLIEALAIVNREHRAVNLLVVGDGPERGRLQAQAAAAGVSAAFVGACYEEPQLAAYFLAASVTVSPGNVGLTCMHSLGYGVPVITHDDPDEQMPEWEAIQVGVTGDVFTKGCARDLAAKIERWTRTSLPSTITRQRCRDAIANRYHSRIQAQAIEDAIIPCLIP